MSLDRDMVTWYWLAATLISIKHIIEYQRCTYGNGATLTFQGIGRGGAPFLVLGSSYVIRQFFYF